MAEAAQLVPGSARIVVMVYDKHARRYQDVGRSISGITVKSLDEVDRIFAEVEEVVEDRKWRDKRRKV